MIAKTMEGGRPGGGWQDARLLVVWPGGQGRRQAGGSLSVTLPQTRPQPSFPCSASLRLELGKVLGTWAQETHAPAGALTSPPGCPAGPGPDFSRVTPAPSCCPPCLARFSWEHFRHNPGFSVCF